MAKHDDHATLLKAYLEEVCTGLDRRRRAPAFRQWQKAWLGVPLAAGLSLAATQCSGTSEGPSEECTGDTCLQLCGDEVDNDADGAIDCDDPDCSDVCTRGGGAGAGAGGAASGGAGGITGTGGIAVGPVYSAPLVENCDNGADEDGDGLIDCDDPDCDTSGLCLGLEYGMPMPEECADGVDNDWDNAIDCDDLDCQDDANCVGPVPVYAQPLYAAPIPSY